MDELLEYDGQLPNIADYLMSVGCVKKQQIFRLNDDARELVDSDFTVLITMTGIKDCDLTEMPDGENTVHAEATICYPHYKEHKVQIIHDMWIQLASLIYCKKETENATAIGHTGNDKPH